MSPIRAALATLGYAGFGTVWTASHQRLLADKKQSQWQQATHSDALQHRQPSNCRIRHCSWHHQSSRSRRLTGACLLHRNASLQPRYIASLLTARFLPVQESGCAVQPLSKQCNVVHVMVVLLLQEYRWCLSCNGVVMLLACT